MKIAKTPAQMSRLTSDWVRRGLKTGFVPTMGALHDGHLSLIEKARSQNDRVVVSIFVNPLQFGPGEDYARYPRPVAKDEALCRKAGADVLYLPQASAMYPEGFKTRVEVAGVSEGLCGRFRPGHFQGVATVVLKLFETVRPARAYFGEKDYQQLAVIRRMVRDIGLPVSIVACPTVREKDGLAMSSRNAYLSPEERSWAPKLSQALKEGSQIGCEGGYDLSGLIERMRRRIEEIPKVRIDYVEIVDAETLEPPSALRGGLRILAAVRIGRTRLIDNVPLICKDK